MNSKVSEFYCQFTDLIFNVFDSSEIKPHELFFLFSVYRRTLEWVLKSSESKLTPEQRERNREMIDVFLNKVAEMDSEQIEQLPEVELNVHIPFYIPPDMVEERDPDAAKDEVRIEALLWLSKGDKRVIGKSEDYTDSLDIVENLYDKGAESVEVVDPPVGGDDGCASVIRVVLPWDPTEDVSSSEAPAANAALAALTEIGKLDAHSIKQSPDMENAFYISWIEEESE